MAENVSPVARTVWRCIGTWSFSGGSVILFAVPRHCTVPPTSDPIHHLSVENGRYGPFGRIVVRGDPRNVALAVDRLDRRAHPEDDGHTPGPPSSAPGPVRFASVENVALCDRAKGIIIQTIIKIENRDIHVTIDNSRHGRYCVFVRSFSTSSKYCNQVWNKYSDFGRFFSFRQLRSRAVIWERHVAVLVVERHTGRYLRGFRRPLGIHGNFLGMINNLENLQNMLKYTLVSFLDRTFPH